LPFGGSEPAGWVIRPVVTMEGPDREGSVGQLGLEQRMLARTRSRVDDLALGANVLGAGRGAVCGDELEGPRVTRSCYSVFVL
jgi:hypothetical protein